MKHFLKAGMKPGLNAHSNVCQSPAAWQEGSKYCAPRYNPVVNQYFGVVFS